MTSVPPAAIGDPIKAIDTPALIVDLDAFEANLAQMAAFARAAGLRLRPHAKMHRCPAVGLRQIAAGAVGLCCQTVGEAEAMVAGGIVDVLVTNEIVSPAKLDRLARLATGACVGVLADSPEGVAAVSRAAASAIVELSVLVEIEVGMGRCGVAPGEDAAELARRIADSPGLRFGGVHAYHGRAQHLRTHPEREQAIAQASQAVRETLAALAARGLRAEIVTGAGTGTYGLEAASGLWTELQVGSYAFMDGEYAALEGAPAFRHSLFVLAEVISANAPGRAIVNAGLKSVTAEKGLPLPYRLPGAKVAGVSDEHSVIASEAGSPALRPGDRVRLIPGHCDPTVNLHDWIVAVRGERVEDVWPVTARGASR